MKAKICDCCGCAYVNNRKHATTNVKPENFLTGISLISYEHVDFTFDLCDDCIKELLDYISSHKKNEVIK